MPATSPISHRLESERLILKAPEADDLVFWMKFFTSERSHFMGGGPDASLAVLWNRVAALFGHWQIHGFGQYVIFAKGHSLPIGAAGIHFPLEWPEPEYVCGLWDPQFEGKGIAREAAYAVFDHIYDECGWDPVVGYIHKDNNRSFSYVASLGAKLDPDAETPVAVARVVRYPATGADVRKAHTC